MTSIDTVAGTFTVSVTNTPNGGAGPTSYVGYLSVYQQEEQFVGNFPTSCGVGTPNGGTMTPVYTPQAVLNTCERVASAEPNLKTDFAQIPFHLARLYGKSANGLVIDCSLIDSVN